MNEKNFTKAGTDVDEVKRLNAASGPSYNETLAMLAKEQEVKTNDEMPLRPLTENLEVDSGTYKVNEVPGSGQLGGNGPH
ncbi:hypothetical protein MKZ25_16915 [Solibacillus sp. FSL W7-1464]|uniref:hypothetical protein n=1 Tax=Solibacillus sp. FSL W7-1464 TaxID=2921706 RepID=UPI0030F7C95B